MRPSNRQGRHRSKNRKTARTVLLFFAVSVLLTSSCGTREPETTGSTGSSAPFETTQSSAGKPSVTPVPTPATTTAGPATSRATTGTEPTATATLPTTAALATAPPAPTPLPDATGVLADLKTLCGIGSRRVGTAGSAAAREWIAAGLASMGYAVSYDPFVSTYRGNPEGINLSVVVPGADRSRMIVIGAHYDTIEGIEGCEDNATGVAALLDIARRLAGKQPVMDVCIVFFDSEEYGHSGSEHFAAANADRTALMINLDCVGYGDYLYAYSREGAAGSVREYAIGRAAAIGVDLTTHAGYGVYPAGTVGAWSDHASFESRGVDFLYLEGSNVAVPGINDWWGYTAEDPYVLHTGQDTMAYLLPRYGERMERHMTDAAILSADLALNGFTSSP